MRPLVALLCSLALPVLAAPTDPLYEDLDPQAVASVDWSPLVKSSFTGIRLRGGLTLERPTPTTLRISADSAEGQARLEDFVAANAGDADVDIKGVSLVCTCGGESGKCVPASQRGSDGIICAAQGCSGECSMDVVLIPRTPTAPVDGGLRFVVQSTCHPSAS